MPGAHAKTIAVLPLGAHEQHGPHLPFETDSIIAGAIAKNAEARLPAGVQTEFLPVEAIGYSPEHLDVEGTRSLGFAEAVERWISIAGETHARGIRKFVMLNAHGGNSALMTVVATELRVRLAMLAVATSWTRFGVPDGLIAPDQKAIDIHGGFVETSVMLALRPDLVDMTRAADFPSRQRDFSRAFAHLRAYGPHAFGWMMRDLNPQRVAGNAAAANADAGEKILDHAVQGFVELLGDVDRFDLSLFE